MANEKRMIDANALIAEYDRVHVGEPGKARKLIQMLLPWMLLKWCVAGIASTGTQTRGASMWMTMINFIVPKEN